MKKDSICDANSRVYFYVINEPTNLTSKEMKILKLLYSGNTKRKISQIENLELSTVKFYVNNILYKMNYKSYSDLISDLKELKVFEDILN